MEEERFALTDLSDRLQGPAGAEAVDQTLQRLRTLQAEVKQRAEEGVPPDIYDRLGRIFGALASAERIMIALRKPGAEEVQGADRVS